MTAKKAKPPAIEGKEPGIGAEVFQEAPDEIYYSGEDMQPYIEELSRRINEKMGDGGGGFSLECEVMVFLKDPEMKRLARIWTGDLDSYDLESLAMEHGSGVYAVKIYSNDPVLANAVTRTYREIAYRLPPKKEHLRRMELLRMEKEAERLASGEEIKPASAGLTATDIAAAVAAAMPKQVDPMDMMVKALDFAKSMMPQQAEPAQKTTAGELMDLLELTDEIRERRDPSATPKENESLADVAKKLLPEIMLAIKGQHPQQTELAGHHDLPAQPLENPVNADPPPAALSEKEKADEEQRQQVTAMVGMLVKKAMEERSPAVYAEVVLDELTEEQADELMALPDDIIFQFLDGFDARVKLHKLWFTDLIAAAKLAHEESLKPDENDKEDPK
jgi:hypothetical protein